MRIFSGQMNRMADVLFFVIFHVFKMVTLLLVAPVFMVFSVFSFEAVVAPLPFFVLVFVPRHG